MSWLADLFTKEQDPMIPRKTIEIDFLTHCEYDTVDFFSLNGWTGWAKVVKLYDGDTMTVILFVNNKPFKFRIRLSGIDTAEKTSDDPEEVTWAKQSIEWCVDFIGAAKLVYLHCHRMDKYGRVLATIFNNDECKYSLNSVLLGAGLAYEYNGGKRRPFKEWALDQKTIAPPTLAEYINDSEINTSRQ